MSARKTARDVSLWSVGGVAYLGSVVSHDYEIDIETDEGKAMSDRYDVPVDVKRKVNISGELLHGTPSARKCNLDLSAVTVGSTSFFPDVKNVDMDVKTKSFESSGAGDEWEYNQATGTTYSGTMKILVPYAATTTVMTLLSGPRANLQTTFGLTSGLWSCACPILLNNGKLATKTDEGQEIDLSWMGRGAPTSATGASLLQLILTGTAAASYGIDYGSQKFNGNLLISTGKIAIADKTIMRETYSFLGQGAPTLAAGGSA